MGYPFIFNRLRNINLFLCGIALVLLFFKMPETPHIASLIKCSVCPLPSPFLPLLGSAYFSLLLALSLFFPSFPGKKVAIGGLLLSAALAFSLTLWNYPKACTVCISCHVINILIWILWILSPSKPQDSNLLKKEKVFLVILFPLIIVSLFSSLNLTFRTYRRDETAKSLDLKEGGKFPAITLKTISGQHIDLSQVNGRGIILNFLAETCPYCKEQVEKISPIFSGISAEEYLWVNVSPKAPIKFAEAFFSSVWVEDSGQKILYDLDLEGYPTLLIINGKGSLVKKIVGVPDNLEKQLLEAL